MLFRESAKYKETDHQAYDLQSGDVLCKYYAGGAVGTGIMAGQAVMHPFAKSKTVVHTALYIGDGEVAEASAGGIHINKLDDNLKRFKYKVYRYTAKERDKLIPAIIERVYSNKAMTNDYSMRRAIGSNLSYGKSKAPNEEKMLLIDTCDVFCSGTVVDWYNRTAYHLNYSAPFPKQGNDLSPQALDGLLKHLPNWEFIQKMPLSYLRI